MNTVSNEHLSEAIEREKYVFILKIDTANELFLHSNKYASLLFAKYYPQAQPLNFYPG